MRQHSGLILLVGLGLIPYAIPALAENNSLKLLSISHDAKELISQAENNTLTRVTGVELQQTKQGLQVILKTPPGQAKLVPLILPDKNNLVIDILDATLAFSIRNGVTKTNPAPGISEVRVSEIDATSIRVIIAGAKQAPRAEVVPSRQNLVLSVIPQVTAQSKPEQEIEIVVTGQAQEDNYAVPNSNVGTRTDAAIKDVSQAIQVIPRKVIEDQGASDIEDVLRNASSVSQQGGDSARQINIRGFEATDSIVSDGISISDGTGQIDFDLSNIEQVEVLKGPSSVLYGSGEPGGTINIATKKPLRNPFYEVKGVIGEFNRYQGAIDLTGSIDKNKNILYRFNASYGQQDSFVDFAESEELGIFPVISFQLGKDTTFSVEGRYEDQSEILNNSNSPTVGTILPNPLGKIPRDRFLGEPDFNRFTTSQGDIGYRLDHRFGNKWSLRNQFRASFLDTNFREVFFDSLEEDNRTVIRSANRGRIEDQRYTLQTDVNGKVKTGAIKHDLLVGLDLDRNTSSRRFIDAIDTPSIDLFNPEYGNLPSFEGAEPSIDETNISHTIGFYAQDLLSIGKQVNFLLGGRFDWSFQDFKDKLGDGSNYTEENAFSPRVGIVYQPIESVSLYAGWSRSFVPQSETDAEGNPFQPTRGEQFEVGVKNEFLDGQLSATLAVYQITKKNDLVTDPDDPNFSIQVGENRSRGVEFDLTGEPVQGLQLIATYAYTDAEITEDTTGREGNPLGSVPQHSGSLWAVYELQEGTLKGLGFGAGIFAVSDFALNSEDNTPDVPGYVRTDALLYYQRDNWRSQLNIDNLFNTEYFESPFAGVIYGAPFTVRGQISAEF
ncbi:MAG: TonB-dependent siderophore receptor [Waterburya sp.]